MMDHGGSEKKWFACTLQAGGGGAGKASYCYLLPI